MRSKSTFSVLALALVVGPAYAHTGGHTAFSFESGFFHPLGGLDHLLAMFAVGLLAAQLGGGAVWLVPGTFVVMMLAGALVGFSGAEIPGVELGVVLSAIAVALPVALAFGMPVPAAMTYVGFFAVFHGFTHGAELPADAEARAYIAGFVLATALVHALGVLAGLACGKASVGRGTLALRIAGGLVVLAGLGVAAA